ncbi:polar amino acid transport system ATP-binding protein [Candidatus Frackibacter sp. WG12]|uniref:amino acid ABC transporter ATP-binding protein n=2 Tax=unclassified Candidatus Frackibacter TaxID=2648818 RepID=UPI0008890DBB|nr:MULTISPECIES: amino acid ABC transporter ATP-binding protein [unclassified Candidatus Frackibacter]SDC09651.1 polar amino acid transport system ATP-binding protein [Candidatus Frackibacter sp. WG11]SEM37664.1 polar amino acid transport system ATP-binding protein [Candidatus Frackibacter sp. WG12]SFL43130.1 polar amino acid transport system ATP-binding protein [Candidatus Frackibacter sp. WG13]
MLMLEVRNLYKSYEKLQVLKGVNFTAQRGETVVIMGPSGCGKSTTIRCINRLTEPDKGQIIYKEQDLLKLEKEELLKVRQEIGFVFQNFNLINRLNVFDNIMLALLKQDLSLEEKRLRVEESLRQVKLMDFAESIPKDLSGGQKQRVGIARSLALQPDLMLLDEPTAALDPILVKEVLDVLEKVTANRTRTLLIVTHEIAFAYKVADRILLMDDGKIVEAGSPKQIFETPNSEIGKKYKDLFEYE